MIEGLKTPKKREAHMEFSSSRPQSTAESRWERSLASVRSSEEIIATTRDYLNSLSPELLARLPEECRPGPIKYEDDIDYWAYRLTQYYCADDQERVDGTLLRELIDYFLHALIRLAELHRNLPGAVRPSAQ
jgi:hypothetical protein